MTYLSGQLDADWARSDQQDPISLGECPMRLADLLLGVVGVDQVRLGREWILRPRGQHGVVSGDLLARRCHYLDDLEAASLVERRPDPGDRRARRVVATQLGTELLATLNARLRAAEAHLLAPLDREAREIFRAQVRFLATRAGALDPLDSPCELGQEVDAELPSSHRPTRSARIRINGRAKSQTA